MKEFTLKFRINDNFTGLHVGAQYKKNDIVTWSDQYKIPHTLDDIILNLKNLFTTDYYKYINPYVVKFKLYFTDKQYILNSLKIMIGEDGYRWAVASFVVALGSIISSGAIANYKQNQYDIAMSNSIEVCNDNSLATSGTPPKQFVHKKKLRSAKKELAKKYTREQLAKIQEGVQEIIPQSAVSKTVQYRRSKVAKMQPKDIAISLLNQSENFYPIIYNDNRQRSVGFGSYISYEDCVKLWKRAGLTPYEGNKLAEKLGSCGWKEGQKIIESWKNKPGVMTLQEANALRDKELNVFAKQIDEHYAFLPELQRRILSQVAYNVGFFGLHGGKIGKKVYPPSELSVALHKYDYWDDRVKSAFLKLKTHLPVTKWVNGKKEIHYVYNQGLANRRVIDWKAFSSTKIMENQEEMDKLVLQSIQKYNTNL